MDFLQFQRIDDVVPDDVADYTIHHLKQQITQNLDNIKKFPGAFVTNQEHEHEPIDYE